MNTQNMNSNSVPTPAADLSKAVMKWVVEHAQDFDFAHIQANMLTEEFIEYRRSVIESAKAFFDGLMD
jgi:hypothetical protein